jgi:hypothetical protein
MAPLLAPPERPPDHASYLNRLALAELACSNQLLLGRYEAAIADATRQGPTITSVPTLRICLAQARRGLGRDSEALSDYQAAAQALGAATPGRVLLEIAKLEIAAGRRAAARSWIERASRAADADAALHADIARVRGEAAVGRADRGGGRIR